MKPPIVPHSGTDIDTVNFRSVKESESVDISGSKLMRIGKGVPLDSGLSTPDGADPFEEFNSVTLHHDGYEELLVMESSRNR
jgi:protein-serine/threonine kinase